MSDLRHAAMQLADHVDVAEALVLGLPVPRSKLRPAVLEAVGIPASGPDVVLDHELALRVAVGWNGTPRVRDDRNRRPGDEGAATEPPFRLRVRTAREIAAAPEPATSDLLLGPLVVRGARTIVVGDTGAGKTTLALQLGGAVLTGAEALGYRGAGAGPLLVFDLEQGERSIRRVLRETSLDDHDDVAFVAAPDGLELDADGTHRLEVERVVAETRPAVVVVDPFYKAHRSDSNEERAVVDLMRYLDALRARYGFALVLPAHPRKDPASSPTRKLTLHDVAGSGAVTRGAELVVAIERLSHGYGRLRFLKDRDHDLPVGDAWPLVFAKGEGYRLDPKEEQNAEELERRIIDDEGGWRTVKEWAGELRVRENRAKTLLDQLIESGRVESKVGPPGRSPKAHCYRTAPTARAKSGVVTAPLPDVGTAPTAPTSIGDVDAGRSNTTAPPTGAVDTEMIA